MITAEIIARHISRGRYVMVFLALELLYSAV